MTVCVYKYVISILIRMYKGTVDTHIYIYVYIYIHGILQMGVSENGAALKVHRHPFLGGRPRCGGKFELLQSASTQREHLGRSCL